MGLFTKMFFYLTCLKLGDTHPYTLESMNNLIDLYEAWNKSEKAEEWQAKLPQIENMRK